MSHSQSLRLHDIQAAYRLLGECREVGADVQSWMHHFDESIPRLVGAQLCLFGEVLLSTLQPLIMIDTGWETASDKEYLARFIAADAQNGKVVKRCLRKAIAGQTSVRDQLLTDREWYGSDVYNDYMRPTRMDPFIISAQPLPGRDTFYSLLLQRTWGTRPFPRRAADLASFCLRELTRAGGPQLACARDPSIEQLSSRLRQVLRCLLEGDSELQVARRLALSSETVHRT